MRATHCSYGAEGIVCPGQALLLIFVFLYLELTSCLAETTSQRCLVLFAVRSLSKIYFCASLSESECKGTTFSHTSKIFRPKFDIQLSVSPAVQHFAFFICGAVYYKLFSILIFLKGIFLYFSRS